MNLLVVVCHLRRQDRMRYIWAPPRGSSSTIVMSRRPNIAALQESKQLGPSDATGLAAKERGYRSIAERFASSIYYLDLYKAFENDPMDLAGYVRAMDYLC
jgi:hypothetical protein